MLSKGILSNIVSSDELELLIENPGLLSEPSQCFTGNLVVSSSDCFLNNTIIKILPETKNAPDKKYQYGFRMLI